MSVGRRPFPAPGSLPVKYFTDTPIAEVTRCLQIRRGNKRLVEKDRDAVRLPMEAIERAIQATERLKVMRC